MLRISIKLLSAVGVGPVAIEVRSMVGCALVQLAANSSPNGSSFVQSDQNNPGIFTTFPEKINQ